MYLDFYNKYQFNFVKEGKTSLRKKFEILFLTSN